MGTITLIRHGQASFGKADYDQLSDLGYEQGRQLGHWWRDCGLRIDRVLSGGMRRHQQTAEACLESLGADLAASEPPATDAGFREYDHTEMLIRFEPRMREADYVRALFTESEHPRRAFQALFTQAFGRWMSGRHDEDYGEPWPAFRDRCMAALERTMDQAGRSQHTVVFTSGGPITAICQQLLGLPDDRVAELNASFANGSITRLLYQPGRVSLSTMNAYPHLERLGDPAAITYR